MVVTTSMRPPRVGPRAIRRALPGREIEILAGELSRGFGLGGRPRRAAAVAERARLAVTRAIRYALERVAEHDPALAEHLPCRRL